MKTRSLKFAKRHYYSATRPQLFEKWIVLSTFHYPADSGVCFVNIYPLMEIYPVENVIQPLNNWGLFPGGQKSSHEIEAICASQSEIVWHRDR